MAAARKAKPRRTTDSYSLAVFEAICEEIATSERGLDAICNSREDWPSASTVHRWLSDPDERFAPAREKYALARARQGDYMASQILAIADDGTNDYTTDDKGNPVVDHEHIQRSKLRVDARKFLAAKLAPRIYGDRVQHDVRTPDGVQVDAHDTLTAKLDALAAKLGGSE